MTHYCEPSFRLLASPETYLFGVLFSMFALAASVGNTLALVVFCHAEMKSIITNRLLSSLCVVGALFGYIHMPLFAWNMFDNKSPLQCRAVLPRVLFSVALLDTATLNVCIIVYDRYVLLKKVTLYSECMKHNKVTVLLAISWLLPSGGLVLFYVSMTRALFNIALGVFLLLPFIVLGVLYLLLKCVIRAKKNRVKTHKDVVEQEQRVTRKTIIDITSQYRHVKLAEKVLLLVLFYLLCMTPFTIISIASALIKAHILKHTRLYEILYVISVLIAMSMIFIHLVIYVTKYSVFQNTLRKLFGTANLQTKKNVQTKSEVNDSL